MTRQEVQEFFKDEKHLKAAFIQWGGSLKDLRVLTIEAESEADQIIESDYYIEEAGT